MTFHIDNAEANNVVEYWGDNLELASCEELGELIQAISKMKRYKDTIDAVDYRMNLKEEIRDALICISALCRKYKIQTSGVNDAIVEKLNSKKR